MPNYCVKYQIMGIGYFFAEAPSLASVYEEMYFTFKTDNSLNVLAKYPYGFEILGGCVFDREKPPMPDYIVTNYYEHKLKKHTAHPEETLPVPPNFADTGLFDFGEKSGTDGD